MVVEVRKEAWEMSIVASGITFVEFYGTVFRFRVCLFCFSIGEVCVIPVQLFKWKGVSVLLRFDLILKCSTVLVAQFAMAEFLEN